ncbi:kinase-like domain-containing protein [Calycina marina]|uniref:Kinase-like domain-containing protein n=1 Tax=Calycina marina TaxID=1763456 RepID=A0A9P7Z6A7_9HELO|nr:kinase-like domain-containing protein [Calycina marina]
MLAVSYIRGKDGSVAACDFGHLFGQGSFKYVYEGKFVKGPRTGSKCVFKVFKEGSVYASAYFAEELTVYQKTARIVKNFNSARIFEHSVGFSVPEIWTAENGSKGMVEPMLSNFRKFNSNSGAVIPFGRTGEAMQALSHFSYHISNGDTLFCDIQGAIHSNGDVTLTDPVVMSRKGRYGPTDLRDDGIRNFMELHQCGAYCRVDWNRPGSVPRRVVPHQVGTFMVRPSPQWQQQRAGLFPAGGHGQDYLHNLRVMERFNQK